MEGTEGIDTHHQNRMHTYDQCLLTDIYVYASPLHRFDGAMVRSPEAYWTQYIPTNAGKQAFCLRRVKARYLCMYVPCVCMGVQNAVRAHRSKNVLASVYARVHVSAYMCACVCMHMNAHVNANDCCG